MDEYWKALINGLTPEPNHVGIWWKAPLIILLGMYFISLVL